MPSTNISVGTAPGLIFTPSVQYTSVVVANTGTRALYLGQTGVTAATGLPLAAGQTLTLVGITAPLYAVAGVDSIVSPTSTASGSIAQGATSITVASGGTSFTNGMVVSILDGNNTELVTVGNGSTGTSVVISATAKAHASGVTFGQFQGHNGGSVKVSYGV